MQIRNSWRTTNNAKWLARSENSKSLNYHQQWKLEIHTNKKCGNMCKHHVTRAINSPSLSSSLFGVVIHSPRCHLRSLQFIKHDPQKYPKNDREEDLWNNIGILDNGGTVISASLFNRLDRTVVQFGRLFQVGNHRFCSSNRRLHIPTPSCAAHTF